VGQAGKIIGGCIDTCLEFSVSCFPRQIRFGSYFVCRYRPARSASIYTLLTVLPFASDRDIPPTEQFLGECSHPLKTKSHNPTLLKKAKAKPRCCPCWELQHRAMPSSPKTLTRNQNFSDLPCDGYPIKFSHRSHSRWHVHRFRLQIVELSSL
jgi:hypothetical protein